MLKIQSRQCDQCLFSKRRVVSAERMREIVRKCQRDDAHFICHKTKDTCCAGFYKRYSTNFIRVMGRLNGIVFVDPETGETMTCGQT